MSGGGEEVRKRAMRREQRVKAVDWRVATTIARAISKIRYTQTSTGPGSERNGLLLAECTL